MARLFDGNSNSLVSASTIDLSSFNKLSVSLWLYWDAPGADDDLALEHTAGVNNGTGGFNLDPNQSSGGTNWQIGTSVSGSGVFTAGRFARPSTAAWHHVVMALDNSVNPNTIAVWIDGVSQTFNYDQQNTTTGNFANDTLNVMCRNNASLFGAGRQAELAIWGGILLGQTDVDSLYNSGSGTDARNVQNGSLVNYWQICGTASPEPAVVGGVNMTVNGATSTTHPISGTGICGASGVATQIPAFIQASGAPTAAMAMLLLSRVDLSLPLTAIAAVYPGVTARHLAAVFQARGAPVPPPLQAAYILDPSVPIGALFRPAPAFSASLYVPTVNQQSRAPIVIDPDPPGFSSG